MKFEADELNRLVSALRFAGMAHMNQAKQIRPMLANRAEADRMEAWGASAFKLSDRIEAEMRAQGIPVNVSMQ